MQNNHKRKTVSFQMLGFEFRKVIGNPYVHIFGVGMPVLMMIIITRVVMMEIPVPSVLSSMVTTIFLGIGTMIPMASIFMGYGVSHAQELEKGIPQRMELFGIKVSVTLCNRILSELIFMAMAFVIYFVVGYVCSVHSDVKCDFILSVPWDCFSAEKVWSSLLCDHAAVFWADDSGGHDGNQL